MSTIQLEEKATVLSNLEAYFETHDTKYIAEDAVFKNMGTGTDSVGREAIAEMLHYIYHVAFEARAVVNNYFITEKSAVLESTFTGKHTGEFAGIPATNKTVNVPLCVTYDLNDDGLIQEARIYMLGDVLMRQLTS